MENSFDLDTATAQQVFEKSARHLLTQKECSFLSRSSMSCAYRGEGGKQCAAGPFISDKEYKEEMEGRGWSKVANAFGLSKNHAPLVGSLQCIHDDCSPSEWRDELIILGEKENLSVTFILAEFP